MSNQDLLNSMLEQEIVQSVGSSYALKEDLFADWLRSRGLTFNRFFEAQFVLKNEKQDEKKNSSDSGEASQIKIPKVGSVKNWRAGRPVGLSFTLYLLGKMQQFDPDLATLSELGRKSREYSVPSTLLNTFKGYWEEYHFLKKSDESIVCKGLLCIVSTTEVYYTIYEPESAFGKISYEGYIRFEGDYVVVVEVSSSYKGYAETLSFRYTYDTITTKTHEIRGLCSGVNFDKSLFGSSTVAKKIEDFGFPTIDRKAPKKFVPRDDDSACAMIAKEKDNYEYGPKRSLFHKSWNPKKFAREVNRVEKNQSIDVITTYIPNFFQFDELIKELSRDYRIHKFRCVYLDPKSLMFKKRFQMMEGHEDAKEHSEFVQKQADQVSNFREISKIGDEERGVKFDIRYSALWPMGMGFQMGKNVLLYGSLYATRSAMHGPLIEIRDYDSQAFELFRNDFERHWIDATDEPEGD